jgi:beta-N-acetylhexosaminidase
MRDESVDRLAAACLLPSFPGLVAPEWVLRWAERGLGGLTLFAYNVQDRNQLRGLSATLPGLLLAIDEEGGDVTRLEWERGSSTPGNLALGVVDDVELTEAVAGVIAADLADCGIGLNFAPVADVNTNPRNPVIGVRSFGSDPDLVARHVAAFVRGTQARGVVACAKHFPGHGDTATDSHLALPVASGDWEAALVPFRAAIDAGVGSIMTAHLVVPALDDEPATLSKRILTDLLRDELGYDGLVISDALEMRAVADLVGVEEAAVRSIAAGADALCVGHDLHEDAVERIHEALVGAVADGRIPAARLEEAADRVHRPRLMRAEPGEPDRTAGARAAARALRVEGRPEIGLSPFVIELAPPANIAAGEARHNLADILGAPRLVLTGPAEVEIPPDATPIVVLRDAARHTWQRELAAQIAGARPDAVLIETGLPGPPVAPAAAYLTTYGAGRINLETAASLLRTTGSRS